MKKCPFCAEKIQDEAIVCRYCGRDLPATGELLNKDTPLVNNKLPIAAPRPKTSAWILGATVAAIITVLGAISSCILYINHPVELIGSLTIGSLFNFMFWWLIISGTIGILRKEGGWIYLLVAGILLFFAGVMGYIFIRAGLVFR